LARASMKNAASCDT